MKKTYYPRLDETMVWDTLPNGLTLAVVPRKGFQKKLAYFVTDYGSIHNEFFLDGQLITAPAGVAHYLEHKLFDMPDGDVTERFAALGASPNAFTSYDMTAYHFSCTENFMPCLQLLLEFVSTPYFTPESVEKEQGIIGQEIGMTADNPEARIFENLMEAMYHSHPIRTPILGTAQTIARITPQVLRQCHEAFYRPENMLLCVVGDVDPEQIRELACRVLPASVPAKVEKKKLPREDLTCPRQEVEQAMEVAMPMFQLGFKCAPAGKGKAGVRQEMLGDLAAEMLFGESSRLYLELYESGLVDGSFGGGFETVEGMAMLSAFGDSDDPRAVREAVLRRAEELCREGIPAEDFLRMKRSALGRRIKDLDSFDATCFRICAYYFSGFDYFEFPEVFQTVELPEVLNFIQQTVTREGCCLSIITPNGGMQDE